MVEFITLFLAMVWGPVDVAVAVDQRVATVELFLDGREVGSITGSPWRGRVDFGNDLLPHDLVAVALDARGRRLGETRQWINLSRALTEARWVVDPKERWPPKRARLVWESFDGAPPRSSKVKFNMQTLEPTEDGWVTFPAYDADTPQSLHAQLRFEDDLEAQADLVFGGVFGEVISSELSAVVLLLPEGEQVPSVDEATRWIRSTKGPVEVSSMNSGPAFVILVVDPRLWPPLPMAVGEQIRSTAKRPRKLRRKDRLYLLQTSPQAVKLRPKTALFKPYAVLSPYRGKGILYAARRLRPPRMADEPPHILDALAVAGRLAARSGRPRCVFWLYREGGEDRSIVDLPRVRKYLEALQVPLVTWKSEGEESLVETVSRIQESLARQVVVWIEGRHLPQEILLSKTAPRGLRFAGEVP